MSNKVYDILKWIALTLIPALGTLYFGLSQIWGFPLGEEIVGTLTVADTFLGAILGISNVKYKKTSALREETSDGRGDDEDEE
jgi:hypothetical protein